MVDSLDKIIIKIRPEKRMPFFRRGEQVHMNKKKMEKMAGKYEAIYEPVSDVDIEYAELVSTRNIRYLR